MTPPAVTPSGGAETVLRSEFFGGDPRDVARALIGKLLVRDDGRKARLVEVEAYRGAEILVAMLIEARPRAP